MTRLFARTKSDSYNAVSLIDFLKQLKRFAGKHKVILIWDHLPLEKQRRSSFEPSFEIVRHYVIQPILLEVDQTYNLA